jgi:hypothetical protein
VFPPAQGGSGAAQKTGAMSEAQRLASSLNVLTKAPQFDYKKARAHARGDQNVDWAATKALNEDFNPDVDGCESFAMRDGSVCEWIPGRFAFGARAK